MSKKTTGEQLADLKTAWADFTRSIAAVLPIEWLVAHYFWVSVVGRVFFLFAAVWAAMDEAYASAAVFAALVVVLSVRDLRRGRGRGPDS